MSLWEDGPDPELNDKTDRIRALTPEELETVAVARTATEPLPAEQVERPWCTCDACAAQATETSVPTQPP